MTDNKELLDKLFFQQFQQIKDKLEKEKSDVCPSCGHCKHCGRGGGYFPYYVPYQTPPWYYQPYITWDTITSSTSAVPRSNS